MEIKQLQPLEEEEIFFFIRIEGKNIVLWIIYWKGSLGYFILIFMSFLGFFCAAWILFANGDISVALLVPATYTHISVAS